MLPSTSIVAPSIWTTGRYGVYGVAWLSVVWSVVSSGVSVVLPAASVTVPRSLSLSVLACR